jgi:predicted nucleic acid-binding protein
LIEFLLHSEAGDEVARRLASEKETAHAPHVSDLEVLHALRRFVRRSMITEQAGWEAVVVLFQLEMTRWDHVDMLPAVWALRENLTPYDAAYIALAEALDAPLLTCDARLASAPGHEAKVELIG